MKLKCMVSVFLISAFAIFNLGVSEAKEDKTDIKTIMSDSGLLAMKYWDVNEGTFLCIVKAYQEGEFPVRQLVIFKNSNSYFVKVFQYETIDNFLDFCLINNHLMVTWQGGSAFHFKIYAVKEDKIDLVLDAGSHSSPEIADINNDGLREILISEGAFLKTDEIIHYPKESLIYKWDGIRYVLFKKVEWENRFRR